MLARHLIRDVVCGIVFKILLYAPPAPRKRPGWSHPRTDTHREPAPTTFNSLGFDLPAHMNRL